MNSRPNPPSFEQLEPRSVPATWWNPWPDGENLTLSFVPDGTAIGDSSSNLYETLDETSTTSEWQLEVLRAFQTWAVNANINIGVVSDNGDAIGTVGRTQGDDRFGDIRIAAHAMSPEVLAIASPFEVGGGTWSGDVKLNSAYTYGPAGLDLRTVLTHEAGHVFGIDTNLNAESVTYPEYQGVRHTLGAIDIEQIQELYGARAQDSYEGETGNNTRLSATELGALSSVFSSLGSTVRADLTTMDDVDFYEFTSPADLSSLTITLKTTGLSLLTPKLTVLNRFGQEIASEVSADPFSGDLSIHIPKLGFLKEYTVKVERGTDDIFGIGSYELDMQTAPVLGGLFGSLTGTIGDVQSTLANEDLNTNDSFLTASLIPPVLSQTNSRFDFAYEGSISNDSDVDIYRFTAPQAPAGQPNVLSVMTWGKANGGLMPKASVYDAAGTPVESELLVNENGNYSLQVENVEGGADYFVKVEAASEQNNIGEYFLGVDFSTQAVQLHTFSEGDLDAENASRSGTFTVLKNSLFHFVLSAEGADNSGTSVVASVIDSQGNVVSTMTAESGNAVSRTILLKAGTYTLRFEAVAEDGAVTAISYTFRGQRMSDPIGPQPEDTSTSPETGYPEEQNYNEPPPEEDYYYYEEPEETPVSEDSGSVSPEDPNSDPYETSEPAPEPETAPEDSYYYEEPPAEPEPTPEDSYYYGEPEPEPEPTPNDSYYYEEPAPEPEPTPNNSYYYGEPEPTPDEYYYYY